ncbi:MAG: hypothetical protein ABW023_08190 [Sphingomonas sp.]
MPYQPFTDSEVELIFQMSEGRPVSGKVRSEGHSGGRHVSITNSGLADRLRDHNRGGLAIYTAFLTFRDQIDAAVAFLNSPKTAVRLDRFSIDKKQGESCEIVEEIDLNAPFRMRYGIGDGAQIFPCNRFEMRLIKDHSRPRQMHIVTFFGKMGDLV